MELLFFLATLLAAVAANPVSRANSPKAVYAHFMVGIVENFSVQDWITEMNTAKSIRLANAYAAATQVGNFHVFVSFDFAYWTAGETGTIMEVLRNYTFLPSQALYNGRPIVSTFVGDTFDWNTVRSAANVFAIPMLQDPGYLTNPMAAVLDGAFSWYAWPTAGGNSIIPGPMTTVWDERFRSSLATAGRGQIYMMPVSPWFSTHFPSKNWVFICEQLITDRWPQVLQLQPELVEIVSWNDFGESHYISDSEPTHSDDGSSAWATGYPHEGWRYIMQAYIAAYKQGLSAPVITQERVVYWYRGTPKRVTCTNDTLGIPQGVDLLQDLIFVTTMLTSPATLTVRSGSLGAVTINAPAGLTTHNVTMGVGAQSFAVTRNGAQVASGTGGLEIKTTCTIYNYNAYVGTFAFGGVTTPPPASSSSSSTSSRSSSASSSTRSSSSVTTPPPSSTSATSTPTCGAGCTITASAQIFPTNCLQPGCVWAGPAGQGVPNHCDTGGRPCATS
ncbi:hypothetical protein MKEN_00009700 [Mycena kentingensis (nom. inval.)]|nr:hypothetical protein MKEN_00009700 [Mycena kentingensis (nom. inval.)]